MHNLENKKTLDFHKLPSGLYVHDTKAGVGETALVFVETVEENKKLFSSRQFVKAKEARELY